MTIMQTNLSFVFLAAVLGIAAPTPSFALTAQEQQIWDGIDCTQWTPNDDGS
jgi:hypothetical protein